ncbi:unnamed protein product, partial [Prorocentrum cordatum]
MPRKGPPPAHRRGKAERREWLSSKRQGHEAHGGGGGGGPAERCAGPGGGGGPRGPAPGACEEERRAEPTEDAAASRVPAADDLRAFYEAQGLFGADGAAARAEYGAMWASLQSPLPVTVWVAQGRPHTARTEAQLGALGWRRRREFDAAAMSVWEIDNAAYSRGGVVRAWAERENRRGALNFQELVSMVPALLLAPERSHACLDLCAAPGNKSLQLLEALRARGAGGPWPSEEDGAVVSGEVDLERGAAVLPRCLSRTSGSPPPSRRSSCACSWRPTRRAGSRRRWPRPRPPPRARAAGAAAGRVRPGCCWEGA